MAVTAAAKLSIEMGKTVALDRRPGRVICRVRTFCAALRAVAATHSYAAAAGACLVTLMNLAFVNVGLSSPAIVLLSAAIFGLGLAQSKGRVAS